MRVLRTGQIPGDRVWRGISGLPCSGTAPALSDDVAAVVEEACKAAQSHGVTVSCDLNFRRKLWTPEKANAVMSPLMSHVDVLIGNEEDSELVFGIKAANTNVTAGTIDVAAYKEVAIQLVNRFKFKFVATTLRESVTASHNWWSGILFDGKAVHVSKKYEIIPIVDRIGAGDAFSGGLIYGVISGMSLPDALEFAVAASCLKHSIPGDFNLVNRHEVMELVNGDGTGRVQR